MTGDPDDAFQTDEGGKTCLAQSIAGRDRMVYKITFIHPGTFVTIRTKIERVFQVQTKELYQERYGANNYRAR